MAQHDMNIANQGFPATRADLNNALQALVSNSSGTSAPSTTFANQWWYDTTNNKMYIRNEANNAWIEVFTLDQTNNEWQLTTGVIQAKDSDGLALKTDDGTTRLFIKDSDGSIGLGTTSPSALLHVYESGTGDGTLKVGNAQGADTANIGKQGSSAYGATSAGDAFLYTSTVNLSLMADGASSAIKFSTGGNTERMRILPAGGLTFNGDTAAANALDDAEYGTWIPTFYSTGTATLTYARYVKIGNKVTFWVRVAFASGVTANSSRFTLPITTTTLSSGTWTRGTVEGGFIEPQQGDLCYFASSPSAYSGLFTLSATYSTQP